MSPSVRLSILLVLLSVSFASAQEGKKMSNLPGKKVVMIIASQNFRDEEFAEPYNLLKSNGAAVTVASSKTSPAKGMLGKVVTPDILVKDVAVADYDCVIFVGGAGASEYFNDKTAQNIAKETVQAGKVLCAICIAPATLANAGVLKGKKATCFSSVANMLVKGGATVEKRDVVQDGKIITANGPGAAKEFAKTIAATL
jgi:protease I